MPELPDVETFKRYLQATSLHQRIVDVDVRSAYVLKRVSGRALARRLKGRSFVSKLVFSRSRRSRISGTKIECICSARCSAYWKKRFVTRLMPIGCRSLGCCHSVEKAASARGADAD